MLFYKVFYYRIVNIQHNGLSNVFKYKLFFYLMLGLLAFLGLIFGFIVAYASKEELISGKKYLDFTEMFILVLLTVVTLFFNSSYSILIGIVIGFLLHAFLVKNIYFYFGLLLTVNSFLNFNILLFYIFAIFLFGLAYGRRLVNIKKTEFLSKVLTMFIGFILPFFLFFIREAIFKYDIIFNGIFIGASLHVIGKNYR